MTRFNAFSLLKNALSGNKNWTEQWPDSQPRSGVSARAAEGESIKARARTCRRKDMRVLRVGPA